MRLVIIDSLATTIVVSPYFMIPRCHEETLARIEDHSFRSLQSDTHKYDHPHRFMICKIIQKA